MTFLKVFKQLILKFDLMSSSSFLRVRGEAEHTTLLGGFISIALMVALLAIFYNKIIDTFDKIIISSTSTTKTSADPTPVTISTFENSTFMLGVQVSYHNLNDVTRAFDVVLSTTTYEYGVEVN